MHTHHIRMTKKRPARNTVWDLKSEILREHSKRQAMKIARWVGDDRRRFKQLMEVFLSGDYRTTQRSAWIVSICAERNPELVAPWLKSMVEKMQDPGVHDAVRRNVLRILQFVEVPRRLQGTVASLCFSYLSSVESPIAVKAYSMYILGHIADQEPELGHELALVIRQMLPYSGPGIRSSGKKVLKKLDTSSRSTYQKSPRS